MRPFRKDGSEPMMEAKADDWTLAQGERDGFPMIVRIANVFSGLAPVLGYDHHVIVSVHFRKRMPNGFPSSEEGDDLTSLELNLCRLLEADNEAHCVLVVTNNGLRDFIFYTRDAEDTRERLDKNSRVFKGFEVDLAIEPAREWEIYRVFSQRLASDVAG